MKNASIIIANTCCPFLGSFPSCFLHLHVAAGTSLLTRSPQLKERAGSSRQALKKYVLANNNLGNISDAAFTQRFNQALSKGTESGAFLRPKGASGTVKLGKGKVEKDQDEKKPAAPKTASKPKTATATKKTVC